MSGGHHFLPAAEGGLHSLVEGGLLRAGEPQAGEELLLRNPGEELLLRNPVVEPGLGSPGEGQLLLVLEHRSPGELGQGSLEEPGPDVPGELGQDIPGLGIHLPEAWPLGRWLLGGRTSLSCP